MLSVETIILQFLIFEPFLRVEELLLKDEGGIALGVR